MRGQDANILVHTPRQRLVRWTRKQHNRVLDYVRQSHPRLEDAIE